MLLQNNIRFNAMFLKELLLNKVQWRHYISWVRIPTQWSKELVIMTVVQWHKERADFWQLVEDFQDFCTIDDLFIRPVSTAMLNIWLTNQSISQPINVLLSGILIGCGQEWGIVRHYKVNCVAKKTNYAANYAAVNSEFQMFWGVLNGVLIGILVY